MNLTKPLMIFDGDCGFCRHWIERWRRRTGDRIDYAPYQQVADKFPGIACDEFMNAVQLIEPCGARYSGAQAAFCLLYHTQHWDWVWWLYAHVPLVAPLMNVGYRFIASHRNEVTRLTHPG